MQTVRTGEMVMKEELVTKEDQNLKEGGKSVAKYALKGKPAGLEKEAER